MGLFANAGVQGRFERIDRYPIEDVRQLLDVNVVGVFTVLSAVSTAMIATGSVGAAVISASMAGVTGAPNMSAYSATKAAVIGLTKRRQRMPPPGAVLGRPMKMIGLSRREQVGCRGSSKSPPKRRRAARTTPADPAIVVEQMLGDDPDASGAARAEEVGRVVAYLLSDLRLRTSPESNVEDNAGGFSLRLLQILRSVQQAGTS